MGGGGEVVSRGKITTVAMMPHLQLMALANLEVCKKKGRGGGGQGICALWSLQWNPS